MYKHPENPTITWSGRGRKPAWYTAHLESGGKREDLLG
ncbi:H-NS histone family protein [Stagnihabitans tardus]